MTYFFNQKRVFYKKQFKRTSTVKLIDQLIKIEL